MEPESNEPIHVQLENGLQLLHRQSLAAQEQHENPKHMERRCQDFERDWTKKLEGEGSRHLIDGMKDAVDDIRNEKPPDTEFTKEPPPVPRLTAEFTRRQAHEKNHDRDF